MDTTWVLFVGVSFPHASCWREARVLHQTAFRCFTPDFSLRLSRKSFPHGDTLARQLGLKSVFLLLGVLPKAIRSQVPDCQLCHWKLSPTKWCLPIAKSLDSIVATTPLVGFLEESLRPVTGGFAFNCLMPEAWTTEVSRQPLIIHGLELDNEVKTQLQRSIC